jgi:opacity protein-like surface antigen
MRRRLAAAVLLALCAVAAPAAAQTSPDLLQPCTSTGGATVVTLSGLTTDIDAPSVPLWGDSTTKEFVLDLAGQPVARNRAEVAIRMTWSLPVEDYDLNMLDFRGEEVAHSENVQPLDDHELVAGEVLHCQRFSAEALAWVAAGASDLTLTLTATQP